MNWIKVVFSFLVLMGVSGSMAVQADLTTNLEAYWPFDGDGEDYSGNGRDLVLSGNPSGPGFGTGLYDQGLVFTGNATQSANRGGADDAVFDPGENDFAFQVWVNFSNVAGEQTLIEKFTGGAGPGWTLSKLNSGALQFYATDFNITTGNLGLTNNRWYHMVVTRTGGTVTLYLDNVQIGQALSAPAIPDTPKRLMIGERDGAQSFPVRGSIDDVAYWSRGLTLQEVSDLYNGGTGFYFLPLFVQLEENLEGYWPMDGNALDFSGNSRSFTLQGSPPFSFGQRNQAIDIAGVPANYADRNGVDDAAFDPGASDFSIQLWYKPTSASVGGHEVLFEKFDDLTSMGYSLLINVGRQIQFSSPNFGVASAGQVVGVDVWRHIVVTRNGSSIVIYLDGNVVGQNAAATSIPDVASDLTIGRRDGAIAASLKGSLDEVAYWSKGLNPIEVKRLYNGGVGQSVITQSPLIICPLDVTIECSEPTTTNVTGAATLFPGCATTTASFSDTLVGFPCSQTIERLWTATDGCTTEQCTQLIHLVDTTSPVLTTPSDISIDCADSTNITNTGTATATDNCDGFPSVTFMDAISGAGCTSIITRVWTAMDLCGNASVSTQLITVADTEAPVISVPADLTIDCAVGTNATFTGTATATDNCSTNITISFVDNAVGACPVALQRIWMAVDECGNASLATQSIFRADTTAPVIAGPADITVECGSGLSPAQTGWATATDDCSGGLIRISFDDVVSGDACTGVVSRVWSATDACGNMAVYTQTVTLVDTTLPVGEIVPGDWAQSAFNLDGAASGEVFGQAVALSYDGQRMVVGSVGNGSEANVYELDGTNWVQLGSAIPPEVNNAGIGTAVAISADGNRIALGEPFNNTVFGLGGAVHVMDWDGTNWVKVGNSIYAGQPSEQFGSAVAMSADGTRVLVGAPANAGNTTYPGQVRAYDFSEGDWVQAGDTLLGPAPESGFGTSVAISGDGLRIAACAPEYNGINDRRGLARALEWTAGAWVQMGSDFAGASQGAGFGTSVALSSDGRRLAVGVSADAGDHDRAVKVHQWNGSAWLQAGQAIEDTVTFYREVESISLSADGSRIAIGFPRNSRAGNLGGVRVLELRHGVWNLLGDTLVGAASFDLFGDALSLSGDGQHLAVSTPFFSSNIGRVQAFGLEANSTLPFVCPTDLSLECGASTNVADTGMAVAVDACDTNLVISFSDSVAAGCPMVITRTWTATDACGNAVQCDQTITLNDTTAPVLSCPADLTVECGGSTLPADLGEATATDTCDPNVIPTYQDVITGDFCSQTITRTWTAVDVCGNSTSCVQTITVQDTTPPGGPLVMGGWTQIGADLDGVAGDRFGTSVAITDNGQRMAAAGDFNGAGGFKAGIARVYDLVGGNWVQVGNDILGEAARDEMGRNAIALNSTGTRVAIGAHLNDGNGSRSGHVRIFELIGNVWTQLGADIDGRVNAAESGWSLDLSGDGDRVIVGALSQTLAYAQVFELNANTWMQVGSDLEAEASGDAFGSAVSISRDGNRIAVGGPYNAGGGTQRGHVRVFDLNGGVWTQVGSDIDGETDTDRSGTAVELSGDGSRIAIGAPANHAGGGGDAGHVRVFELSGNAWMQLGNDIDGEGSWNYGTSLGLSAAGDRVILGSFANKARVYGLGGSTWSQLAMDIDGEGQFDLNGLAVAIAGDGQSVAVGARNNADAGVNAGHLRAFGLGGLVAGPFCPDTITVTNAFAPGSKAVFFLTEVEDIGDPSPSVVSTPSSGSLFPEGTTTVTRVASDRCGNSATCSFDVVVVQLPFTDTDLDDVDDDWETSNFTNLTTVTRTSDFDLDGQSDVSEFLAGTDPKDANSLLEVVSQAPSTASSLNWTTVAGKTYNVEYLADLVSNSWVVIAINVSGGSFMDTDPVRTANPFGFYRVVVVP